MGETPVDISLPADVKYILSKLKSSGYEAFVVGGCVRDCLLGRVPGDWDVTTNATPDSVKLLFERTADTGLKHGTVTVVLGTGSYEVTTYRVDGVYEDGRHPSKVEFTGSIEADLSRRDFTMNAIAWNPDKGFVDPYNGCRSIRDRIISTVGNAADRFHEDALRMLRAVRFSAQLDFAIHSDTLKAICENGSLVKNLSSERIREELTRTLTSDRPLKFILFRDTGLLQHLLPELEICFHTPQNNPYHIYNVGVHTLYTVAAVENDDCLRWAMLLHDIGKPASKSTDAKGIDHFYGHPEKSALLAANILKRLKFDNKTTGKILRLIKYHDRDIAPNPRSVRRAAAAVGNDIFPELLKVKEADRLGQNPEYREKQLNGLAAIRQIYGDILKEGYCLDMKCLAVNGDDLLSLGIPQGKKIRDLLESLLKAVIDRPELNERERLLKEAGRIYERIKQ